MIRRQGRRRSRWLRVLALGATGCFVLGTSGLAFFLYCAPLPGPLFFPRLLSTLYLDRKGRPIAELPGVEARSHRPVPLNAMGRWIPAMTVAMEDRRFYSHVGVDGIATVRAFFSGHGGGSTITQQLVKVATQRRGHGLLTKAREALVALQLERRCSKAEILEAYLNRIPYGNRMIGIEAAAQAYFNKPAALLSKAESVYLVGLPRAPSRLNPWSRPEAAADQFVRSRKRLLARGVLQEEEISEISLPAVGRYYPVNKAPHFIQTLAKTAAPSGIIRCTLDLDLQRRAEQLVAEHLDQLRRGDISQAAMVVFENKTGAVRALVGSRSFKESQINGALLFRNSGSTLKPLVYATGIDRGIFTAATLLPDTAEAARDAFGDYDPHNFVLGHLGPVRVREALGNSLNVPAVVAVRRIGARKAFDAIGEWGVKFDRPLEKAGAGFVLGNVGVRLLDLTAAFAGLARGGLAGPPQMLAGKPAPFRRLISAEAAAIITDILSDNSARLQSFGPHSALAMPVRVAAKTGTSAAFRDTWTVGFTREHTVGVWVGNFDGRPMDHASSIASAAPLWRRMMEELLRDDHPVPEPGLPRTEVCALTGLLPCAASPTKVEEIFIPGSEPTETAEEWFSPSGKPLLPQEYAGWCASKDNHLGATLSITPENLAILVPREGAVFVLEEQLSLAQQQLEFQANVKEGVSWKVNGTPVRSRPDGRTVWPLSEGDWTLEAVVGKVGVTRQFRVIRD